MRMIAAWVIFALAIIAVFSSPNQSWFAPTGQGLLLALALIYIFLFPAWLLLRIRQERSRAHKAETELARSLHAAEESLERHLEARTRYLRQEIDARKAMESRLQQSLDAQSRQLANQRDFSAMISHELRNPLAIIDTASQSLQMIELGQSADAAPRIRRIRAAVTRLGALADGLQSIERLERDSATREFESVNLAAIARKAVDIFSFQNHIELDVKAEPIVAGDAGLLEVAVANLAGNAVKYAGSYGPVIIAVDTSYGQARLAVSDQGPGIVQADLVHIFKRFFRSEATREQPGAGQGLFLARRICETHGGTITARNVPEGGCEFAITLPLADVPAET